MTIDIFESNYGSNNIEKILRITTAGANKTSLTLSIRGTINNNEDENETDIVLQKAEALLLAETIRIYFEHAINT
jgi:hypothetical protein